MSLMGLLKGTGPNGFGHDTTAEEVTEGLDLSDRHILVTGCNSGLGTETLRVLARRGATVFGAARTERKARDTCADIDGDTIPLACELSDVGSIQACAANVRDYLAEGDLTLDAIVCNAGIMALPELEQVHGYEKQFFVNHVGHFILVDHLLDALADDGRVVAVSSRAHRRAPSTGIQFGNLSGEDGYDPWEAYGQSKLANLLYARELGRRFSEGDTHRIALSLHPGVIGTGIARHLNVVSRTAMNVFAPLLLKTIPKGAATQVYAAVHPEAAQYNGEYLADCNPAKPDENGRDTQMARRLWEVTEKIVDELQ